MGFLFMSGCCEGKVLFRDFGRSGRLDGSLFHGLHAAFFATCFESLRWGLEGGHPWFIRINPPLITTSCEVSRSCKQLSSHANAPCGARKGKSQV